MKGLALKGAPTGLEFAISPPVIITIVMLYLRIRCLIAISGGLMGFFSVKVFLN
jgi:hypothetical protein